MQGTLQVEETVAQEITLAGFDKLPQLGCVRTPEAVNGAHFLKVSPRKTFFP